MPHLPVFSFNQIQGDPAGWDRFAKSNGRLPSRQLWLGVQYPRLTGECFATLDHQTLPQAPQSFRSGKPFYLGPVFSLVSVARMKEALVQPRLITEKQQALRIRVEPANWINRFRQRKIGQSFVR
jgi:hypothetical protein